MNQTAGPAVPGGVQIELGQRDETTTRSKELVFATNGLSVLYGTHRALQPVNMEILKNHVTAFIGPSGCGKSTFIRCFNRLNDLIPSAVVEGQVLYHGHDLYGSG